MSLPKYASLLKWTARVGIFESVISLGYFSTTSSGFSKIDLLIGGSGFCVLSASIFFNKEFATGGVEASFEEDVLKVEATFEEDVLKVEASFGEDVLKVEATFGEDVLKVEASFGEDVLKVEASCGEDVLKVEASFEEGVLEVEVSFEESVLEVEAAGVVMGNIFGLLVRSFKVRVGVVTVVKILTGGCEFGSCFSISSRRLLINL